ncbi:MAG: Tm-1-like ATP-binding domain-containing protein, partial [Oscillospiraceae bacterium]|nr:Tm-1-like ATP-binding domain-containing protein [Oscillospiraceae bacterium]
GVLDITTTEWCDELFGGVLNAGPNRLEAAGRCNVPQVVSVGALDMVNFGPWDTVPKEFSHRNLYKHNPTVTLMRTTVGENTKLGEKIAEQLNKAKGNTILMIPLKGVSMIDDVGLAFYGVKEDEALFDALRKNIDTNVVKVFELNNHINDEEFAKMACDKLIELIENK